MQQTQNQTKKILDFYVSGLSEEKQFDCLKKSGFLNILSQYAASANFDTFPTVIDRVENEKKFRKGSMESKAVLNLKKHWNEEIEAIRKCVDCYEIWTTNETNNDYFTLVCSKPHLVVYVKEAKEEGPRSWPAKVLSVNDEEKTVTIECFGDYLRADYPFAECFLYTDAQEIAREKANAKYLKNPTIEKQDEYKRSFSEVKKYIENIKNKYGSFVPAATKIKLTDVKKHLMDMFPGAFQQNPVPENVVETLTTSAEEVNNFVQPSTSKSHNRSERTISLTSQGYGSNFSNANSESDSDSDNYDNFVGERVELPPVDIKIEQVVENYSQFNDEPSNHSQAALDDPITGNQNRNRKRANTTVPREQPKRAAKRVCENSDFANENINDVSPSSSQNRNEATSNAENVDAMLSEFADINKKIHIFEEQLTKLMEKEISVRDKLNDNKHTEHFNEILDEFGEVKENLSECKNQLKVLKEQEAIIRAELRNSIK